MPDTTAKNHPLDVAKKYVQMHSLSNAAAPGPEERVLTQQCGTFYNYTYKLL